MKDDPRRGFTLIELLVVIAIIAAADRPAPAGRAGGPRVGQAGPMHQQHQAIGPGGPPVHRLDRRAAALDGPGRLGHEGRLVERLEHPDAHPAGDRAAELDLQRDQLQRRLPAAREHDRHRPGHRHLPLPERGQPAADQPPDLRQRRHQQLRLVHGRLVRLGQLRQPIAQPQRLRTEPEPHSGPISPTA